MPEFIPFHKPCLTGRELPYIAEALRNGGLAGDGPFTGRCCRFLEERFGFSKVFLTPSCTAALTLAALLCEIGPGDEVLLPSFTHVSTANAFVNLGARPVFVDIRPDTLNLDEGLLERAITPRSKVVVPVHYGGVGCEMEAILDVARAHGLRVVEDAAQGVNASYRGKALGSQGDLGAVSFHETKNYFSCGAGALLVNDPSLVDRAEVVRETGTDRARFLRGEVDRYSWVDHGSAGVPGEVAGAFLLAQLEEMDAITERRRVRWENYQRAFTPLAEEGLLRVPVVPGECSPNHHLYHLILPDRSRRDGLIARLREHGIQAVFHFVPLHTSPMGRRLGGREGTLPVTEDLSWRLVRLPLYPELSETAQERVVRAVTEYVTGGMDGGQ